MKKTARRLLAIVMSCLIMFLVVEPVCAATISDLQKQQEEIERQKQEAEQKKKQEQQRLNEASGKVNNIQGNVDAVGAEIEEVDNELVEVLASIDMIQEELAAKEEAIEETTAEYEAARATEQAQYDTMKVRIKYLYEKGDTTYLQLLFESHSIGEAINKTEYFEKLYDYDRKLLEEYQQARQEVEALKEQLENEKAELEAQQHELEEEQESLQVILDQKQAEYDDYSSQLARAKQEAAVYMANVRKQNDEIKSVKIIRHGAEAEAFGTTQADFDKYAAVAKKNALAKKEKALKDKIAAVEKAFPGFEKDENGIYFKTTKEGSGSKCGAGKKVATEYKGYFVDGRVFDKSEGRGPLDFVTAAGQMIPGYDVMVQDMKLGEKRTVVLPPDMAYGENGIPGAIPPNSYLAFDIELVSIR